MTSGGMSLQFTTEEIQLVVDAVTPELDKIAAINLARTDDGRGDTLGTFTTETRPTEEQVEVLAAIAANQVADTLGNNIPEEFQERAQGAAALYAAVLVESTARDPREGLMKLWTDTADARVTQLGIEIARVEAGGTEGPETDQSLPVYSFPVVCPLPTVF